MNKVIITALVLLVVVGGLFFISNSAPTSQVVIENPGEVKTFGVTGDHLRFWIDGVENPEIRVNEGDRVRIEFKSTEGFHDWFLDEFNAATSRVTGAQETSVEFVAGKKGTYEYYCSVGQHRANGMKGVFVVE